jgi:hypothetical protein
MTGKKFLDVILEVDRHAVNTPADVRNMVEHDRRVDLNEIVIRARTDIAPAR